MNNLLKFKRRQSCSINFILACFFSLYLSFLQYIINFLFIFVFTLYVLCFIFKLGGLGIIYGLTFVLGIHTKFLRMKKLRISCLLVLTLDLCLSKLFCLRCKNIYCKLGCNISIMWTMMNLLGLNKFYHFKYLLRACWIICFHDKPQQIDWWGFLCFHSLNKP